jgi:hypothetical protein
VSLQAQQTKQEGVHPTKEIVQPKRLSRHELFSEDHTADVVAIQQLWSAYTYYNDTHDGPGIASLFTPDAVFRLLANVRGKIAPAANGSCPIIGREAIATYLGFRHTAKYEPEIHDGLPFPGNFHHYSTNVMVKVNDDGKTAMLTATGFVITTNDSQDRLALPDGKGPRVGVTGEYRVSLRKTSEGWQIADFYEASDRPAATSEVPCDSKSPSAP